MHDFQAASKRIYNNLLINSPYLNNVTLSDGKLGAAIFFYHDYAISKDVISKRNAGNLVKSASELISKLNQVYFEDLPNMGFGFEYLLQNEFLPSFPKEILENTDYKIFYRITLIEAYDIIGLLAAGRYLKWRHHNKSVLDCQPYKEFLIHITDKIFRYYERVTDASYMFTLNDLRVIKLVSWCRDNAINFYTSDRILNKIDQLIESPAINRANIVLQLSLLVHTNKNAEKFENLGFRPSGDIFTLKDEILLLLDISKSYKTERYRSLAHSLLHAFLSTTGSSDNAILGIAKNSEVNYSLSGFFGWGLLLQSSVDNFGDLTWLDLFF